jgi:hypothetical protein
MTFLPLLLTLVIARTSTSASPLVNSTSAVPSRASLPSASTKKLRRKSRNQRRKKFPNQSQKKRSPKWKPKKVSRGVR